MINVSDMKAALEEAARPSLSTIKVDKEESIGMMWEDEAYAQSCKERLKEAQSVARLTKQRRGPATYKPTVKHFTCRYRPDWNQEEDQPIDGRTWVTHADNGRCAFTINMTPPPITHFDVPAYGWDIEAQDSSYPMKTIASEDHATQKNKVEKELESRNELNGLMTNKFLTGNHEAQLEISKDPGAFTVTCGIGEVQVRHCLIDLGAAVNVLPYPLYYSLGLGPLRPPKLSLELGDKSCVHPVGVLEKLMLSVGKLVVPADFYVIPIGDTSKDDPPTIILGRSFLYVTKAKIDMSEGSLSLAFGGRISNFYNYDDSRTGAKKPP